jgi:hypothetical protein
VELYLQSLNTPSWRGAQLRGAQGQLYVLSVDILTFPDLYINYYLEREKLRN